jgi:hypothetical protein
MPALPIYFYCELAALVTSVACWKKIRNGRFRWFLPFLFLMAAVELTGWYLRKQLHYATNGYVYNFSVPIEYIFYTWLFAGTYRKPGFMLLAKLFIYVFVLFCIVVDLVNGVYWFNSIVLIVSNIAAILFSCLYFYELLVVEEQIELTREPMFWIATGVLLFNLGEFLYGTFYRLLRQHGWDNGTRLFKAINNNLVLVLYLCIIIGLLCVKTYKGYRETFVR